MARRRFKRLSDLELGSLSDEELVAYIVAARAADDGEAIRSAMKILVYGRMTYVEAMVARRVPEHAVDAVASEAMIQAMRVVFEGESVGEFVNLLKRVTHARIADHWRSRGRQGWEHAILDSDAEDRRRREIEDPAEEVEAVPLRDVIDRLIDELPEHHQAVVDCAVFEDQSSADTAQAINERFPDLSEPMTPENVDQIKSRFRKALKQALSDGDTDP